MDEGRRTSLKRKAEARINKTVAKSSKTVEQSTDTRRKPRRPRAKAHGNVGRFISGRTRNRRQTKRVQRCDEQTSSNGASPNDKDKVRKLFDWFLRQNWVEEYYTDDAGVKLGVTGVSVTEAKQRLKVNASHLVGKLNVFISEVSSDVEFSYTADPSDPLEPGSIVKSQMSSRTALYSGSVKSRFTKRVGITVRHLVADAGDSVLNSFDSKISDLIVTIDDVFVAGPDSGKTTAELCLFTFTSDTFITKNVVPRGQYAGLPLKLWKRPACRGLHAFIFNRTGVRINGIVIVDDFNKKQMTVNKHNTLMFLPDPGETAVAQGDSGAPVMYADPQCGSHVYVLGIVIGILSHNGEVVAIASRLYDALRAFGRSQQFNCQLMCETRAAAEGAGAAAAVGPDMMEDVDYLI